MEKIYKVVTGFGGIIGVDNHYLVKCDDKHIETISVELAMENYNSYDIEIDGVRSIDDIMEEECVDEYEADEIRISEIEDNLDIDVSEYDFEKYTDIRDYNFIGVCEDDIKVYMRDSRINNILN